jgi:hypothetical protein
MGGLTVVQPKVSLTIELEQHYCDHIIGLTKNTHCFLV